MGDLNAAFLEHGESLDIKADVQSGWSLQKNTFGFRKQELLDYAGNLRLRVILEIMARPNWLGRSEKTFAQDVYDNGGSDILPWELRGPEVRIYVNLLKNLRWLERAKNPGIFWDSGLISTGRRVKYAINLWVVVHPPPTVKPRDIYEWDTPLAPAGLPTLGKRR